MLLSEMKYAPRIQGLSLLVAALLAVPGFANATAGGISWGFYQNVTAEEFSTTLSNAKKAGFLPLSLNTSRHAGRYLSLWQKNHEGRAWASFDGLTEAGFQHKLETYKNKGYLLEDQSIDMVGSAPVYSMIMLQNNENQSWKSYSGLTDQQYEKIVKEHQQTYRATDVKALQHNGNITYAVILKENTDSTLWNQHKNLTPAEYRSLNQTYNKHDFHVADFDCYLRGGQLNYAAIWHHTPNAKPTTTLKQLSATALNNTVHQMADQGMRMIDMELCPAPDHSGFQYATLWQENVPRDTWQTTAQQILNNYVSAEDVPGASAVIMHNGKVLFRSGVGQSDRQGLRDAHSGTTYRLASIAKALVGTLAFDLVEDGLLDLDTRTRTLLPELGSAHTHTLRQLLTNTGCVKGYTDDGLDDNNTRIQYDTSRHALQDHLGGALASDAWIIDGCTNGTHHYSTHGYTILTAAMEAQTGVSFADMISHRISGPLQLDSLKVEDRITARAHGARAALSYKGRFINDNQFQNASWKAGGSGMESSALHLARFADAVMSNFYFSESILQQMWSGGSEDSQFHGWSLVSGSTSDALEIEKGGVNQGTDVHLRINKSNGLTVVAMTNSLLPAIRTPELTEKLMSLAIKQLQSTDSDTPIKISVVEE